MAVNLKDLIDIDLLAYFKSKLDLLFAGKVDKVDGKGLSTNDYTADEKTKLAGIATGAQVNTIEGIQVVGNSVTPANKIVNIPAASQSAPGVMTAEDKTKLDGVSAGAQVNVIEGISTDNGSSALTPTNKIVVLPMVTPHQNGIMSSSDYERLNDIEAGAQVNVIESVKVNGSQVAIIDKAVDIDVPTTVAELTDADNYVTDTELESTISPLMSNVSAALNQKADASSVYTKTEIDQKLVGAMNYKGTKATTAALPSSGNVQGDVWHVTADGSEWAWNGSAWEELGTVIDLSGYVEEDDIGLATTADIDDLFAPTVVYSASTVSTFIDEVPDKDGAITWSKSFSEYTFAYSGAAVKVNWTVMTPEDSTKYRIVSASKNSFTVELKENVSTLAVNAETL